MPDIRRGGTMPWHAESVGLHEGFIETGFMSLGAASSDWVSRHKYALSLHLWLESRTNHSCTLVSSVTAPI
jgi:hypothetical protein